jgi:hypothetical protein
MIGLIAHPNGFLAGFVGNQMYVSEPYQPHAYAPKNVKVFDYPIVALGVYGSTIVVMTTGFTYLVSGVVPETLSVEKLPDPYPCVSKRSVASADYGVLYASKDGLVWVGYGGLRVISRDILSRDDWQKFNPVTMHGVVHDGRYIGFYLVDGGQDYSLYDPKGAGFIFDYPDKATGADSNDRLTTLDFYAAASYANPDTTFHYVVRTGRTNKLLEWEAGPSLIPYIWKSKAFVMPYLTTFAAAKVTGSFQWRNGGSPGRSVVFELLVGDSVKYRRIVSSSEPFRLPRFSREVEPWYVRVSGTEFIQQIHIATSIEELREGRVQ